jgi:hypothetical protein
MAEPRDDDYVFRFRLDDSGKPALYQDAFTEMVRRQLAAMLEVVVLTEDGEEVSVDGFRIINDRDRTYRIFPKE